MAAPDATLRLSVDRSGDSSLDDIYAVGRAAAEGNLDVVRYLCELPVDRGVDPSANGNYAVRLAAKQGHLDVVRYLCELPANRGVDPSANGNYAVRFADEHGHSDVVRYLCELPTARGVNPSAWVPNSALAHMQQQALTSCARSPLLVVRALLRRRRAIVI